MEILLVQVSVAMEVLVLLDALVRVVVCIFAVKVDPTLYFVWIQVPEFEEAAFKAPLNKLVRVKTKHGWHLLQVLSERSVQYFSSILAFFFC